MLFLDRILIREAIDRARRGSKRLPRRLEAHVARLLRERKPLPPPLADFIADRLEGKKSKKRDDHRARDIGIARAKMTGETGKGIADRIGYLDSDSVLRIARERRPHVEMLDKYVKLGNDFERLRTDLEKLDNAPLINNVLAPFSREELSNRLERLRNELEELSNDLENLDNDPAPPE